MKSRNLWMSMVVVLVMIATLFACAQPPPPTTQPTGPVRIPVAAIMDHTGAAASAAIHAFRGVTHYIRWTNEHSPLKGIELDVLWTDDKYSAPLAISAYERFKSQGMKLLFMYGTPDGMAVAELAKKDNVAILNGSRAAALLAPPSVSFCPGPGYGNQTAGILKWFLDTWDKPRKPVVAFIDIDNAAGRGRDEGLPWCKQNLKSPNGIEYQWTEPVYYPVVNPTYRTLLAKMMEAKPDVVLVGGAAGHTGQIWKEANDMGITGVLFVAKGTIPSGVDALTIAGKKASEGNIFVICYATTDQTDIPEVQKMRQAMEQYQGYVYNDPSYIEGWVMGAIGVKAIDMAAEKVGAANISPNDVYQAIQEIKGFAIGGLTPPINFAPDKRIGHNFIRLERIQDGIRKSFTDWIECPLAVPGLK